VLMAVLPVLAAFTWGLFSKGSETRSGRRCQPSTDGSSRNQRRHGKGGDSVMRKLFLTTLLTVLTLLATAISAGADGPGWCC